MPHHVDRVRRAVAGAAAAIALAGCGTPDTPVLSPAHVTGPTSTSATASAPHKVTTPPPTHREVHSFTGSISPSGNVACMIDPSSVRCDIIDNDWSPPPRPADCEFDYGQGISLDADGHAEFVCAGDTTFGPDEVLPYGQSIIAGPLKCDSAEAGFTCRDVKTGRGFSISRQAYQLF